MLPSLFTALDKPCANIMSVSSSGRGTCHRNWTLQIHGNQGNRSFTGLGVGHCTLLLLKSNERCSVLTSMNTGDSYGRILRTGIGLFTAIPKSTAHQPSQKLTHKGTPSAFGQTWTWAGGTLLRCLENCQFVILTFPMSLVCYESYVKINIKKN